MCEAGRLLAASHDFCGRISLGVESPSYCERPGGRNFSAGTKKQEYQVLSGSAAEQNGPRVHSVFLNGTRVGAVERRAGKSRTKAVIEGCQRPLYPKKRISFKA